MLDIKPVETRYSGIHFRSRLEARWAVFFDSLAIEYQYEPEKFAVPGGRYIPDFYLPSTGDDDRESLQPEGLFLEVKGQYPSDEEEARARSLAQQTGRDVAVFYGSDFTKGLVYSSSGGDGVGVAFTQCPFCGRVGLGCQYEEDPDESAEVGHEVEKRLKSLPLLDGDTEVFHSPDHLCQMEQEWARSYGVYSYFAQDYLTPARSPMLDLAIETAKSMRFEQAGSEAVVKTAALAIRRLREAGVYCFPNQRDWLLKTASEWSQAGQGWMQYDEPWYVRHKSNMDNKIAPCDCYHCVYTRKRRKPTKG